MTVLRHSQRDEQPVQLRELLLHSTLHPFEGTVEALPARG